MYLTNIAAAFIKDAQEDIDEARKDKNNKHQYRANTNEVIGILKDRLVFAISQDEPAAQSAMITAIIEEIGRHVVPKRPGRHVARKASSRNSKFHHNRKDNS
jgi:hypothetical protein